MSRNLHLLRRIRVCAFLLMCLFVPPLFSCLTIPVDGDMYPPPWRGLDGSTYAKWVFGTDSTTPSCDDGFNSYGDSLIQVFPITGHAWLSKLSGAEGVWPLSGEIYVDIDNRPQLLEEKQIQIQLIWKTKSTIGAIPSISIVDNLNLTMDNISPTLELPVPANPDWTFSLYSITWPYNPSWERIRISNSIYVDQLVIDTLCIPEPSTYFILAVGAFVLFRIRR